MKALSIRAPWAYLIVYGAPIWKSIANGDGTSRVELVKNKVVLKDVENRSWPLPSSFQVPQRVAVHVGLREDPAALEMLFKIGLAPMTALLLCSKDLPRGALIGEVTITGCVTKSKSPWFSGPYGFILADPAPYKDPIRYKGRQGFFDIETPVVSHLAK